MPVQTNPIYLEHSQTYYNMEEAKKKRTYKAGTVTRRVNELLSLIQYRNDNQEVTDKIAHVKHAMDELGDIQDELISLIDEQDKEAMETNEKWYNNYIKKSSLAIKEAREYLSQKPVYVKVDEAVKLQKLELPKFKSEPTKFHKWRKIFERLTQHCDRELKYDYLLSCTDGEAHRYVENRNDYVVAMEKLVEKYGNRHTIMSLLIDEIKSLNVVKRGDFKSFENLYVKVNDFHEKLLLMGSERDAENSYVLKEIESKLNADDLQKWLESRGDHVDNRTVKDLVMWLDKQTHIRRIIFTNSSTGRNMSVLVTPNMAINRF